MSIYYRIGDLLEQKDINIILNINNLFHTFGAGIALAIKNKYPEAYKADLKTIYGDKSKLGTFSWVKTQDDKTICNLYAMKDLGAQKRQLDYEAFYTCLEKIKELIDGSINKDKYVVGIPYKIGAALAGGDWEVIKSMINSVFGDSNIKVVICVLPQFRKEINWINVNVECEDTYYK